MSGSRRVTPPACAWCLHRVVQDWIAAPYPSTLRCRKSSKWCNVLNGRARRTKAKSSMVSRPSCLASRAREGQQDDMSDHGTVQGGRYGGEWPRERFAAHGVRYEPCEKPKSDLYLNLLPTLNAKRVELLDIPRLVSQLCSLERRAARGGRDSIDHAPGGHDDLANAVAGAAALALGHQGIVVTSELLQRVAAMPATRKHTAWSFRRRAALANMAIPREQQCYPRSVLPAEKFEKGGESR